MKLVGHLRYAWKRTQDALEHMREAFEMVERERLPTPELNIRCGRAAGLLLRATEDLRPILEAIEPGNPENGETPLELAREARRGLVRFRSFFGRLAALPEYSAIAGREPSDMELAGVADALDTLIRSLALANGEAKEPPP